jgi:hypothetical protein
VPYKRGESMIEIIGAVIGIGFVGIVAYAMATG